MSSRGTRRLEECAILFEESTGRLRTRQKHVDELCPCFTVFWVSSIPPRMTIWPCFSTFPLYSLDRLQLPRPIFLDRIFSLRISSICPRRSGFCCTAAV